MSIKLALVNYLNTKPFVYGLENTAVGQKFETVLATPFGCAKLLENDEVDIALVPVAALLGLNEYRIHTDYCIGCIGSVMTVALFSNYPLETCNKIYLDNHSRTSVMLTRLLVKSYWNLNEVTYQPVDISEMQEIKPNEAVLMIGDKVFHNEEKFVYKYDLGEIWLKYTGLPFVFAAWISKRPISNHMIDDLNAAFAYGVDHIPKVIMEENNKNVNLDLTKYYSEYISYDLNDEKRNALQRYLKECAELSMIEAV